MTTRALCWSIVRTDGVILRGTTLDRDLVVTASGVAGTYSAKCGADAAALKSAADLSVNNTEIQGALFELGVSAVDIEAGLFDEAAVTLFLIDWTNPSTVLKRWRGTLGQWTRDSQGRYKTEFRGLTQLLQNPVIDTTSKSCLAELGSGSEAPAWKRCGVDLSVYQIVAAVTSVTQADRSFVASSLDQQADWFTNGKLTWTSGANTGFTRTVHTHAAGGAIDLAERLPFDIEVGDSFTITPGCNKLWTDSPVQYATLSGGTVQVADGVVTVGNISGSTATSGSVSVSGTTATFSGNGTLTMTNAAGDSTVVLSGSTVTATDSNGTVQTIDVSATAAVTGDCKSKFNNTINFRGMPRLQGDDLLLRSQA